MLETLILVKKNYLFLVFTEKDVKFTKNIKKTILTGNRHNRDY